MICVIPPHPVVAKPKDEPRKSVRLKPKNKRVTDPEWVCNTCETLPNREELK